jgi:hypothetical protein
MIEILVYLALHNKVVWRAGASDAGGLGRESQPGRGCRSQTSAEVLGYFVSQENLQDCLAAGTGRESVG